MHRPIALLASVMCVVLVVSGVDAEVLNGSDAPDVIFGTASVDRLDGGGEGDTIFGKYNPAPKKPKKGKRRKKRRVRQTPDLIFGGAGGDVLLGGAGLDVLVGGDDLSTDFLHDSDGATGDVLSAGPGEDLVFSADGARTVVDCGLGTDAVLADDGDQLNGCELAITGSYHGFTFCSVCNSFQVIVGTNVAESLTALGGGHIVFGLAGPDFLSLAGTTAGGIADGGAGVDRVTGSAHVDRLIDDDGAPGDELLGGTGGDVFLAADGAPDSIDCGSDADNDVVYADPNDTLTNCESDDVVTATEIG